MSNTSVRLPANSAVSERIAASYPRMTSALRQFADFVLAEPLTAARLSVHAAGSAAGVSVATSNRFARMLGYAGYPEFRADLIRSFEAAYEPVRRVGANVRRKATSADIVRASLQFDIRNIETTLRNLSEEACTRAVEMILRAGRIFVAGADNGGHLAMLLANGLELYCRDVHSVGNVGGGSASARKLIRFGRDDLVIAIAFPRYMSDTVKLAEMAFERGIPILAITDRSSSPLVPLAKVVLYTSAEREFEATSDTSVLAMIEALCSAVAHSAAGAADAAMAYTEAALPWLEVSEREKPAPRVRRIKKVRGR